MKRIIDGKTYNTKTAEMICDTGNDVSLTDFGYERSDLFVTKKGRYFVAGKGGSLSRFAVADGNGHRGGTGIIPLTRDEAFAEIQRCAGYNTDLITKYFGDMTDKQEAIRRRIDAAFLNSGIWWPTWSSLTHDERVARAERLLHNFNYNPADAHAAGEDTYVTFCRCWQLIYPNEYIQRVQRARQDGGVRFNFISMED